MKVKINCPKCNSEQVEIVANPEGTSPMYKCKKCGYKNTLFPQFGRTKVEDENEDELDEDEGIGEEEGEEEYE